MLLAGFNNVNEHTKSIFYSCLELSVFLLLDWLSIKDNRIQSTSLFTYTLKNNSCICAFTKEIIVRRKANTLAKDLNFGQRCHFVR